MSAETLQRAAAVLEAQARGLRECNATPDGKWPNARKARALFFEMQDLARKLRRLAMVETGAGLLEVESPEEEEPSGD